MVRARRSGSVGDTLLALEHEPVVTFGRRADPRHLRVSAAELARRGIDLAAATRGGDVTYHGPGQLVGYPIVALPAKRRDAHAYLRTVEEALIGAVAEWDIAARREPGRTGVWVGPDKLAAIGVRLSTGWITSHGFALNVGSDLSGFATIVPCGIADGGVTSIARLTGHEPALPAVAARVAEHLAAGLGLQAMRSSSIGAAAGPELFFAASVAHGDAEESE